MISEKQDCRSGLLCAAGPILEERVGVRPYGLLKKCDPVLISRNEKG
jgi:hypothetical protein